MVTADSDVCIYVNAWLPTVFFQDGSLLLTSATWSQPLSALWGMKSVFDMKYVSPPAQSCASQFTSYTLL